jgi:membrane dipeptidase
MTSDALPVFDGHNDTLLRLNRKAEDPLLFLERREEGHLDLPRARAGGFAGGLFAAFTPSERPAAGRVVVEGGGHSVPAPEPPSVAQAQRVTIALRAALERIARASAGALRVCGTVAEIRAAMAEEAVAAVFHIEGAEAIDTDLDALEVFHAAGLRSIGPVWSRSNAFGHGVPFRYPSTPNTGPGLTDAGKALVRACNALRIVVDLAHLNEQGFWDVAGLSEAPLVASHANAHAVCPASRNLTDRQLDAFRESQGLVGLNLSVSELRPDGTRNADTPLEMAVRHVDHLVERMGIDCVGLGSDFDGTIIPQAIKDVAGLPHLFEALRAHGYDDALLRKIGTENWYGVLERTWGR